MRKLLLLPVAMILLTPVSCQDKAVPPPAPVTDTEPIGEGLSIIGYSVLGASVVATLGKMIR